MGKNNKNSSSPILRPKTVSEFQQMNKRLNKQGYIAIDFLKQGGVKNISLGDGDPAEKGAQDMALSMGKGGWSNGPLTQVAWQFDSRDDNAVQKVNDQDGEPLGLGYVEWGPGNSIPSVIPPLAQASPYTAAPLRYIADTICGLGPALMYRFPDGSLCDMKDAGYKILEQLEKKRKDNENEVPLIGGSNGVVGEQKEHRFIGDYVMTDGGIMTVEEARSLQLEPKGVSSMPRNLGSEYWNRLYAEWEKTWYGYDETNADGDKEHISGAKEFIEENNLDLHLAQCMQDHVMLDMFFPTVGFDSRGRRKQDWRPRVKYVGHIEATIVRMEKRHPLYNRTEHVYLSQQWRKLGIGTTHNIGAEDTKYVMYPAAMPQHLLQDMHRIVDQNQKTRLGARPMWVTCPTFYPSLNKPYYPQPAWWSVFTSKAFDFSATILYDKYKQRDNATSWSKILYISLDWLNGVAADLGISGDQDAIQKYVDDLDGNIERFLQSRENNGKFMRQWMWTDQKGDEHYNVKIVDVAATKQDAIKAGKEELELSTSPMFLALQVDPRLVGVPMAAASNGGTALREMQLLKQQQLNIHQRLYLGWLQRVTVAWNGWSEHCQWVIKQQTFTTLDNSKSGVIETVSGEKV